MKPRYAALLLLGVMVAVAGCPGTTSPTAVDETKTSNTKKPKTPAPSKSPGAGTSTKPSGSPSAGPSKSPSPSPSSTAGGGSPSPSPSASASAGPNPSPSASASASPAGEDAPTAVVVGIKAMDFQPGQVTVKAGGKVTFINRDTTSHSIQPDGNTAFTGSGVLAGPTGGAVDGEVFNVTLPTAGTVKYVCGVHATMKGTIIVVP